MSASGVQDEGARRAGRWLGADVDFRRFFNLVVFATFLPVVAMPLLARFDPGPKSVLSMAGLLTFLGGPAHVSVTAWLYADRVPRDYFRAHAVRYYWAPLGVIVAVAAAFWLWPNQLPTHYINLTFSMWLLWHYQKQNWGIVSFCSRVSSREPASRWELWALRAAVIAGWMAALRPAGIGHGTLVEGHEAGLFQLAVAVYAVVPVLVGVALVTQPALRRSPPRLFFLIVSCAFFAPSFLFDDNASGFLTYALAHGLQYHVFMSHVAAAPDPGAGAAASGRPRVGVATLVVIVLTLGAFLYLAGDPTIGAKFDALPLYGLVVGITMAHFIVDAGIWRLRDDFVRGYVGNAFPFMRR
jgi:hypothetical protein